MTPPRVQIGSLFLCYAVAGVFWGAFAAAAPEVQARSGLDAGGFGLALGAMTLTAFPVMQVYGRVVTRIAAHAIPLAMTLFAAGCLVLAMAEELGPILLAFSLIGGASGALDIALNLRTARIEEDTGARLFNRTHAVFPFAMLLTSAAVGWLRAEGATVAMIFPCVATGFFVVAAAEWRAGRGQRRVLPGPGTARAPLAGVALLLGAIAALGAFQEAAPQNWAAIFMETVRGSGPVLAGLAPASFTLGLAVGRLVAHVIEDSVPALTAVRGAACLAIAGFATLALPLPEGAVLAVFLLAGMGVGPIEPAVFRAVAHRTDPAMRGRSLATVTSVAYMGYLLSPPILGGVAGGFGWGALWAVAAVAAATVAGLSFALRRA